MNGQCKEKVVKGLSGYSKMRNDMKTTHKPNSRRTLSGNERGPSLSARSKHTSGEQEREESLHPVASMSKVDESAHGDDDVAKLVQGRTR